MNLLAGKTLAAVVTLMVPLLLLTACSHATKPVPPPVTLGYCGNNLQVRPHVVIVVCNTDDITARNLIWSDWGKPAASAKGSATVDLCAFTDCVNGDYISVPIEMTASKVMHCSRKTRAYSTLRYMFPKGSPFKDLPGIGYTAGFQGQDQTVPPKNQKVILTC